MNSRLFLRVIAPAVAVGLLLLAACLAGARYINRLQQNLADILRDNVTSLQAAQELEIRVRQLRFRSLLYLMDPNPARLLPIEEAERQFEDALAVARQSALSPDEQECVRTIQAGYQQYQAEQARLRSEARPGRSAAEMQKLADTHPIHLVADPCQELTKLNQDKMAQAADESRRVAEQGNRAMLLLGLAGPVGGLALGYGVARAVRQSIYRLSVHVQDLAQHLDRDVTTVSVVADGDFHSLDRQMQHIVRQVEAVAERLQQHQRELLRAEQLAAVGQLAAGVAHEVRNPLTGIKMLIEAARRPANPQPLDAEDLRMIHQEITRLEQTVQGLLDFARLPAPQRAPCDLGDVVCQARDLVRARAEQQRVAVELHAPGKPVVVPLDRNQFYKVLVNLFLNALDAMPDGGRLDVAWGPPAEGQVQLTVADTGGGIPPEVAGRLFTPFATTKPTGTGLGLSLSARVVQEHGGTLRAENRPEGGARFVITLPAEG
jgi:signal transduction histidine kinase